MTLTEKLRPWVERLLEAAGNGDAGATQVIELYRLYCDCPTDPGAPALCNAAFDDWLRARGEP